MKNLINSIANALAAAVDAAVAKVKAEPVVLIDAVKAVFVLLAAFGFLVSPDHQQAVEAFIGALVAIFGVGAVAQRAMVTPNSKVE